MSGPIESLLCRRGGASVLRPIRRNRATVPDPAHGPHPAYAHTPLPRPGRSGALRPGLPTVLPARRDLGPRRAGAVAVDAGRRHRIADRVRSRRLARPRNAVRLRRRGDRRVPPDRDPELDRPPAAPGSAARRPRFRLARRARRRCALGLDRPGGGRGGRHRLSRRPGRRRRARDRDRAQLAQPARPRRARPADRRQRALPSRRNPARGARRDLDRRRAHRPDRRPRGAELHAQLAGPPRRHPPAGAAGPLSTPRRWP